MQNNKIDNLKIKIAYNTVVQIVSKIIATVLGLLVIAMITRYLGVEGFGYYTTIITFLSFFGIISDLGLTLVTAQMISKDNQESANNKILNNLLGLRLISALIFLGLAPLVVIFFPYEPIVKTGIIITTLSFLFIALNQILVGLFQKKLKMDRVAWAEIISRVVLLLATILAIKLNFGLLGIMSAMVISSFASFVLHFLFAKKFIKLKLSFDFNIWKNIIQKTWPLALTIFFNLIYLKSDILILSLIKTQSEVGFYGAPYRIVDVLITVPFMFAGIILPILTNSWAEKNKDYFKKVLQKSFDFMIILAIPLVVGTQFVAKEIMIMIAGNSFAVSGPILQVLIIASGLIFIACLPAHAIIAMEQNKKMIKIYAGVGITALIGYFVFIPIFSYWGAVWVTIYSELMIAIFSIYYVWKFSGFLLNLRVTKLALISSFGMGLCLFLIPDLFYQSRLYLILILIFASSLYFLVFWFLGGFKENEKLILERLKLN